MNNKKDSNYIEKGQKRGRGRPPKIINKEDDAEARQTFKTKKIDFGLKKPKSVKKGKMDVDAEQMLRDLEELGRIKPVEKSQKNKKRKKIKDELIDLPESPLKKMIDKKNNSILKIGAVFFAIVILFMFSILYLLNSKTVINIELKKVPSEINTNITYQLFSDEDNLANQEVVAIYSKVNTSGTVQYEVGYKEVVSGVVEGRLRIINESNEKKVFVRTTRFISETTGDLYRLKEDTVIPANGSVDVIVYADNPLVKGEDIGTRFKIPGLKTEEAQRLIYGESLEEFVVGTTKKQIIDENDISKANDLADVKLKEMAIDELRKKIEKNGNYELLADSLNYVINNKKIDAKVGDEKSIINVSGNIEATGIFIDRDKILNSVKNDILSSTPSEYNISINKDDLKIEVVRADYLTKSLTVSVKGNIHVVYDIDKIIDKNEIAGMSINDFYQYITKKGATEKANVVNYPFWNKGITTIKDNIIINVR